jgi:putative membrane protein
MWSCNWGYGVGHGGWFFGHGLFGVLFSLLLAAALVYIVILTVRAIVAPKNRSSRDRQDSLAILQAKFARGEISEQEYLRLKEILTG